MFLISSCVLICGIFFSSDMVSKLSKIISGSVLWCVLQVFVVFLSNGGVFFKCLLFF